MVRSELLCALVLTLPGNAVAQNSFWTGAAVPELAEIANDARPLTLGLSFVSDVAGAVAGVRFYKGPNNTGTHVGALWSSTGKKLASVTFNNETASGWQQANFSPAVPIAAGTPYVISYFAPRGSCAFSGNYAWPATSSGPLHVYGSSPGLFKYGSEMTFPDGTWNSNYWVDVWFAPAAEGANPISYSISGSVTGPQTILTLSGTKSGVAVTDGKGDYVFPAVPNGSYVVAPSQAGYTFRPLLASLTINDASVSGLNFTAVLLPTVSLSWAASPSPNIAGYNIYRGTTAGGPYGKLNAMPVSGNTYTDQNVALGDTYFYVTTAVGRQNVESVASNEARAVIPLR